MSFLWSENAAHAQTLFRPWAPDDGYTEAEVVTVEARLGITLPPPLRGLYRDWGRRKDMLAARNYLADMEHLEIHTCALIVGYENQSCTWWAIPLEHIAEENPPVYAAEPDWLELPASASPRKFEAKISGWQRSHDHLSDFLDGLIYTNAVCGGSCHGGYGRQKVQEGDYRVVKEHWEEVVLPSFEMEFRTFWVIEQRAAGRSSCLWTIYRAPGLVLTLELASCIVVAAQTSASLDEVGALMGVDWSTRW